MQKQLIFDLYADNKQMERYWVGQKGLTLSDFFAACNRWMDKYGDRIEIRLFTHDPNEICRAIKKQFAWEKHQAYLVKTGQEYPYQNHVGQDQKLTTLKTGSAQLSLL